MIIVTSSFSKSSVFKCFPGTRFPLRFRDGLVWTVGLAVGIKLPFQISPLLCERCFIRPGLDICALQAFGYTRFEND